MTGVASLVVLDLECAAPPVLAEFYRQVLGWDITVRQDEYAEIADGSARILFTRVAGYQGPGQLISCRAGGATLVQEPAERPESAVVIAGLR